MKQSTCHIHRLFLIGASLIGCSSAMAALEGRAPVTPGGTDYQAYYDTDQDITWLANANLAATNNFGNPFIAADGSMNWFVANDPSNSTSFVTLLNAASYLGVSAWRMPVTGQPDPTCSVPGGANGQDAGFGCTGSEMGYLFAVEGISASTPGPFINVQPSWYISSTLGVDPSNPNVNWAFNFGSGSQWIDGSSIDRFAWPVTDGDPFSQPIEVSVDIKPGSYPNSINLCSNGSVPVAIFGSVNFDTYDVEISTLRFAEAAVKVVGKKDPNALCNDDDLNNDGYADLICQYVTTDIAGVDGETTSATVNGELLSGETFQGSDSINIVKDTCM